MPQKTMIKGNNFLAIGGIIIWKFEYKIKDWNRLTAPFLYLCYWKKETCFCRMAKDIYHKIVRDALEKPDSTQTQIVLWIKR